MYICVFMYSVRVYEYMCIYVCRSDNVHLCVLYACKHVCITTYVLQILILCIHMCVCMCVQYTYYYTLNNLVPFSFSHAQALLTNTHRSIRGLHLCVGEVFHHSLQ